jgi:hypothetical protein
MPTIDQLIQQKQQEVERLQAQIEVLKELASEVGGSRGRGGRHPGRPAAGQRRGRARRGANQRRVLGVLSATPMRTRDIAAAAKLTAPAVNQVLIGLKKSGAVEQTGRGLYGLAAKTTVVAARGTKKPRKRRARRRGPKQRSRRSSSKTSKPAAAPRSDSSAPTEEK